MDRATYVASVIMNMVTTARGNVLRRRIEELLREEFWDERREGVADRGDASL
jgi:hypothetical protein